VRQLAPTSTAFATALLLLSALLTACTTTARAPGPGPSPDDVIKAATQRLTDVCLTRRGLVPPRPGQGALPAAVQRRLTRALFGAGRAELAVRLPTGPTVRGHTDGCLAAAQRRLYGDQRRWFRVSVIVNNLRPEAARTHLTLTEVRARHRAELTDWQRMRTRALEAAKPLLVPSVH
jgi:hypothetical protein